jgi:hypothetical protein
MVTIETLYGNFIGYRYETYSNRVVLFSLAGNDELAHVVITSFIFREVIRVTLA